LSGVSLEDAKKKAEVSGSHHWSPLVTVPYAGSVGLEWFMKTQWPRLHGLMSKGVFDVELLGPFGLLLFQT